MLNRSVKRKAPRVRNSSMRAKRVSNKPVARKKSLKKKNSKNSLAPVNMNKLEGTQFFCVSCGKVVEGKQVVETTTKNKRNALKGQCVKCGTNMLRFLSSNNNK